MAAKHIGIAILLMVVAGVASAETDSDHTSGLHSKHSAVLNHGKKWETDETLRRGMENIRQAMIASQQDIEKERLGAQDYQRLAIAVNKNVADMLKNCKLSKGADSAFHLVVLNDLTQSAELMRTAQKIQLQRVGALGVLQSLHNYGEYFQHPGWQLPANSQ
jgi:hypothetical protein